MSHREATAGAVGVTMNVTMIITSVNAIITRAMWESSRSPRALKSSDNASSVKLEEQISTLPLLVTH